MNFDCFRSHVGKAASEKKCVAILVDEYTGAGAGTIQFKGTIPTEERDIYNVKSK